MDPFMKNFLRTNTFLVAYDGSIGRQVYKDSSYVDIENSKGEELSFTEQQILREANGREKIHWYYDYVLSQLMLKK